jgi:hypothetical protein
MILRSLLLLLFLIQAGFSPLLAGESYAQKQKLEKSESKSKPVKSDVLEEDEDESESEKHLIFLDADFNQSTNHKSFTYSQAEVFPSLYTLNTFIPVPIIIWVQDFRI